MNKDLKLFLMILLIIGAGFATNKINITGNTHLTGSIDPTELHLTSDPPGANFYLSGSFVGTTPLTLNSLDSGNYEFLLKKTGYYDLRETIKVTPEQEGSIRLVLTKIGEGNLFIDSNVKDAEIYIDNELRGLVPGKFSLKEGVHDLKVRKEGYADFFTSKLIRSGQKEELKVILNPKDHGSVYVQSVPSGKIFVDNTYLGKTPNLLSLAIGSKEIRIELDGYETQIFNVDIDKNERKEVITKLEPSLGTLFVGSDPFSSSIYIDGEYKGDTPKIVTGLKDGFHTIKLSKEYYKDYINTVNVKRLYLNKIYVSLVRK